jgi:tyrosinase
MSSVEYHYPVIGRKGTGGIFDRLPIQTLQKDQPYQFALFILASIAIQQRPDAPQVIQESAATFMQIASIHGKPYVEWAGDRNKDTSADYSATDKKDINPVPSRFGGTSVVSTVVAHSLTILCHRLLQVSYIHHLALLI